ncbi:MAG: autotransporter-associated beta strand repeat-containing protein [Pirellulales bacterium]|nr:autotransporter-associated beta strand repeat-containing protein [Pirellulales bacterium]
MDQKFWNFLLGQTSVQLYLAKNWRKALLLGLASAAGFAGSEISSPMSAHAADGSWLLTTGGSWNDPASWTGGIVADGQGFTGTFSTALGAAASVTLDGDRTIGNLVFGVVPGGAASTRTWTINPGTPTTSKLTLDVAAGSPQITVNNNRQVTLNVPLEGTDGFTKTGAGNIALTQPSTLSGTVSLSRASGFVSNNNRFGSLRVGHPQALGTANIVLVPDAAAYNALNLNFATGTMTNNVTLPASGPQIELTSNINLEPTFGGKLSGGHSGMILRISNSDSVAKGGIIFSNPANDFTVDQILLFRGMMGVTASSALGNPTNRLVLDVTRGGAGQEESGLHFLANNVNLPNPVGLREHTVINVNGNNATLSGVIEDFTGGNFEPTSLFSSNGADPGTPGFAYIPGSLKVTAANLHTKEFDVYPQAKYIIANANGMGDIVRGTDVVSGGTVALESSGAPVTFADEPLTIDGMGSSLGGTPAGALENLAGDNTYNGPITITKWDIITGGLTKGSGPTTASIGVTAGTLNITSPIAEDGLNAGSGLTKVGPGTLTLSAINGYTGPTTVNGGTLVVAGTGGVLSTAYTVNSGGVLDVSANGLNLVAGNTLRVGRQGAPANDVIGNVTLTGSTLEIGASGASNVRTATFANNLTLDGTTLKYDLSNLTTVGGGVNDLINVVGDLTLNNVNPIQVNRFNSFLANGTYTLLTYSGTLTGNAANLSLFGGGVTRQVFTFDTSIANQVNLNVSGTPANLEWRGDAVNNIWDLNNGGNNVWKNLTAAGMPLDTFFDLDTVTFNDNGSASPNVQITASVNPLNTIINATTKNYVFDSVGGSIGGVGGLTKTGSGNLTLNVATNSFTGPVSLSGGTVRVTSISDAGIASSLGAGSSLALENVTLIHTGGSPSFSNKALTIGTGNISILANGSSLFLTNTTPAVMQGAGPRTITLGGTVADVSTFGAGLSDNGGPVSIIKNGPGTWVLAGDNNISGPVTINAGNLSVGNGGTTGSLGTGDVTMAPGSVIDFNRSGTLVIPNNISGNGSLVFTPPTPSTFELGGNNTFTGGVTGNEQTRWVLRSATGFGTGPVVMSTNLFTGNSNTLPAIGFRFDNNTSHVVTNDFTFSSAEFRLSFLNTTGTPTSSNPTGVQVTMSGKITGGGPGARFFVDATAGGNHGNALVLTNPLNDFVGTIQNWRGTLAFTSDAALGNPDNDLEQFSENLAGSFRFDAPNIVLNPLREIFMPGSENARPFLTPGVDGEIAGPIHGTGTFIKQGSGTLTLSNPANDFVNDMLLQGGFVRVAVDSALGAGTVDFAMQGGGLATSAGFTTARNISVQTTGGIRTDGAPNTTTHTGILQNQGIFTKSGAGKLVLQGEQDYSQLSTVAVTEGTLTYDLAVAPTNPIVNVEFQAAAGGTLELANAFSILNNPSSTTKIDGTLRNTTNQVVSTNLVFGNNAAVQVGPATTLKLEVTGPNTSTVGTGVTVGIAAGSTLELSGNVSALGTSGGNAARVITSSSTSTLNVNNGDHVVGHVSGPGAGAGTAVGQTTIAGTDSLTVNGLRQQKLSLAPGNAGEFTRLTAAEVDGGANGLMIVNNTALNGGTGMPGLLMSNESYIDLNDNDLVLFHSDNLVDPNPIATITQYLDNYYTFGSAPGNNVPMIGSTTVDNSGGGRILIAVDNANSQFGNVGNPFYDITLGDANLGIGFNQVIVRFTYPGDYNLDGQVDGADYVVVDSNLGVATPGLSGGWTLGDGDFDGMVTAADYLPIDSNFGSGVGNPLSISNPAVTAIPEPSTWVLGSLAAVGLGILSARRRKA